MLDMVGVISSYAFTLVLKNFAELPALHPGYAIPTVPDGGNHTPAFASAAATDEAYRATLDVAEALALTGARVVVDDDWYEKEVRIAFETDKVKRGQGVPGVA